MEKRILDLEGRLADYRIVRNVNEIWNTANVKNADRVTLQELASYVLDGKPIFRNAQKIVYGEERKSEEV